MEVTLDSSYFYVSYDEFDLSDKSIFRLLDSQNRKNLTFKVIFLRQKLTKSLRKKKFIEEYQFRTTTFAKIIFC